MTLILYLAVFIRLHTVCSAVNAIDKSCLSSYTYSTVETKWTMDKSEAVGRAGDRPPDDVWAISLKAGRFHAEHVSGKGEEAYILGVP